MIINSIKSELYKATHNKYFIIALILAFIIQVLSFTEFYSYFIEAEQMETIADTMPVLYDNYSVYVNWIGHEATSTGFYLATYMLPLIAVLPFGWSLFSEIHNNYQNNMICRLGKTKYFTSKYIAVFFTGAFVVAFMLLSNFVMCSFIGVLDSPRTYTLVTIVFRGHFASKLLYTHPFVFMLIWTGIAALWGGALAGLTMVFAQILKKSIFVLAVPFVIPILLDSLLLVFHNINWSFIRNYFVTTSVPNPPIIFFEIFALIAIGYIAGLVIYKRKEAL